MIALQGVSRYFKMGGETIKAVDQVTFQIKDGDFVAIMGPSGSGKTTLLNLIGALDKPTAGRIIVNGQNITELNDKELSRFRNRTIGFVFQSFNLQPIYSAMENVLLPLLWSETKASERIERAGQALERVGLKNRERFYPWQLSAGQRQRVSIARALVTQPKIILADEPTGNLDSKTGGEIVNLLRRINASQGTTVVVITHDPNVGRSANRTIQIKDGKVGR